jgi:hypothetical protein
MASWGKVKKLPEISGFPAFVAQRIEHLTTDQKVGGSSPSKRTLANTQREFRALGEVDLLSLWQLTTHLIN